MVQKENWEEICGDLHAVRIIGQTGGFPKSSKENLKRSLQCVLQKSKDFATEGKIMRNRLTNKTNFYFSTEESPPKKRRLDSGPISKGNASIEESKETEPSCSKDVIEDKATEEAKEEARNENELKEIDKNATTSAAPPVSAPPSAITSTRSDLIKDIESHIEIIYECLDELNETAVNTSGSSKTACSEPANPSSDKSAQDMEEASDKNIKKNDCEVSADPAQEESKNE